MNNIFGANNTQLIIDKLIINSTSEKKLDYVLVVGGANIEYIYEKNDDTKLFMKQNYSEKKMEFGGSGLNYTLKLMNANINVFPILPLGDDNDGEKIKIRLLADQAKISAKKFDLTALELSFKGVHTMESLIISEKKGRTIWANENKKPANDIFNQIIEANFDLLKNLDNPTVVMIGHIHSDANLHHINNLSTAKLIDKFYNKSLIYVNLGRSQLSYGFEFWKDTLKKIDILQFNLEEVKHFFSISNYENSLVNILKIFQELNLNVVITLDKLGAICIVKKTQKIIYAQEFIIDNYKDKTGAGDSFACGIVFDLIENNNVKNLNYSALYQAVETGRTWASYTCTHLGGASYCPNKQELNTFYQNMTKETQPWGMKEIDYDIVNLIDKAYSRCNKL
jgi:sugar/nucleoside kinase (ribokinase family)